MSTAYPQTNAAVGDSLNTVAYNPGSGLSSVVTGKLITAAAHPSIVERCHQVIAALAPVFNTHGEDMPLEARKLLAGCIYLCNESNWAPRGGLNYTGILVGVIATLPEPEPEPEEEPAPEEPAEE